MRQSNGIDILGANDPRAASIGIIYVSPHDDRKSVLAAIITQERFGRKQVAVVLPPQNKAFRRPGDFEDLKSMRSRLQTHVVFIAPSGPGPGDFASQRRFPVYPSLESYAQALREDQPIAETPKKGWFGTGKQKPAETRLPNPPAPSSLPQQPQGDHDVTDHSTVPFMAGAAAGGAAALAADSILHADTVGSARPSAPGETGAEDDYAVSPDSSVPPAANVPQAQNIPTQMSATHAPNGSGSTEPAIIDLVPRRGRITRKLPEAASAAPVALSPLPNRASRQQNSGKIAAGAGAAIRAAGAMVAGRAATGGGAPPPIVRGPTGGRGPIGGSSGGSRRARVLALALLLLSLLFVCGGLAYAQSNLMKNIIPNLQPPATVTITPASQVVQNTYVILAVTGTPNAAQHQVSARILTASPSQQETVTATGQAHTPGTQATGTLTFSNGNFTSYTVGAGTVFTSAQGVQVVTNVPAVIPKVKEGAVGTVTIAAHAVAPGAAGNIPEGAINIIPCCASKAVSVTNTAAFTGGQDPKNYSFLQQSDVDSVANPLKNALVLQAQSSLKSQMRSGEQPATAPQCMPKVNSNQPVGDTGVTVSSATVTVTVTCKQEVYDQQGVETLVSNLLTKKANTDLGPGYALVGSIVTNTTVQGVDAKTGTVSLLASAKGKWVYQFSDTQKQALAKLIAGMNAAQAKATLKNQPGVADVSIPADVTTFPTDPTQIAIVIQPVTGFSGGGTSPSSTPAVTGATVTTGTPTTGTPTPQPGKGSSSGGGGGS